MDTFLRDHETLLKIAKEALSACLATHHPKCPLYPIDSSVFLPTRLLDLEDVRRPRLIVTSENEVEDRRYVPLSHQWGVPDETEKRDITTTTDSLVSRNNGFNLSALPIRYQTVLILCYTMGIRYVWIDSFCILQDSPQDWELEWPTMAKVYESGVFTICSNLTGNGDVFIPPEPLEWAHRLWEGGPNKAWLSRLIVEGPLSQRAWCLQERHLSPRILHVFHGLTWVWECNTRVRGCNLSGLVYAKDLTSTLPWRKMDFSGIILHYPREVLLALWDTVLLDYTRRKLTFEKDKLHGISAVVQKLQPLLALEYLAGIWESDIYGLMWHSGCSFQLAYTSWAPEDEDFGPEVSSSRAPSFSWASVNGSTYGLTTMIPTELCAMDRKSAGVGQFDDFIAREDFTILAQMAVNATRSKLTGSSPIVNGSPSIVITGYHSRKPRFDLQSEDKFMITNKLIYFDKRPLDVRALSPDDQNTLRVSGNFKYLRDSLLQDCLRFLFLGAKFGRGNPTTKAAVFGLILLPTMIPATFLRVGIFKISLNEAVAQESFVGVERDIWLLKKMERDFGRKESVIII